MQIRHCTSIELLELMHIFREFIIIGDLPCDHILSM